MNNFPVTGASAFVLLLIFNIYVLDQSGITNIKKNQKKNQKKKTKKKHHFLK